jgi:hypothetical protein
MSAQITFGMTARSEGVKNYGMKHLLTEMFHAIIVRA